MRERELGLAFQGTGGKRRRGQGTLDRARAVALLERGLDLAHRSGEPAHGRDELGGNLGGRLGGSNRRPCEHTGVANRELELSRRGGVVVELRPRAPVQR